VVRQWRVDATHSNSYQSWRALGAPDYPTEPQVEEMAHAGRLRPVGPDRPERGVGGEIIVDIPLALPSVSLVELVPAGR
jgi:xylan 1,4-beta-xylosidase